MGISEMGKRTPIVPIHTRAPDLFGLDDMQCCSPGRTHVDHCVLRCGLPRIVKWTGGAWRCAALTRGVGSASVTISAGKVSGRVRDRQKEEERETRSTRDLKGVTTEG